MGQNRPVPCLHDWCPDLRHSLPHLALGEVPTPVRQLSAGDPARPEIWLKDESRFGSGGWGGNKVRKLEWLLPEAKRSGRRTILTFGGLGTNWGLATALYGRDQGLRTALALIDQPVDGHVEKQLERLRESGATLHFTHSKLRTVLAAPWLMLRHSSGGRTPLILPAGGSSPLGSLGYVETAFEIAAQVRDGELPEPGQVVVPAGSGGTAAGLALGFALAGLQTRVLGVAVTDQLRLDRKAVSNLAGRSARLLRDRGATFPPPELNLEMTADWMGPGYGISTPESKAAIVQAREWGLELDPVYTAKAMAALLSRTGPGTPGEDPILFLNTNGPR